MNPKHGSKATPVVSFRLSAAQYTHLLERAKRRNCSPNHLAKSIVREILERARHNRPLHVLPDE